MGQFILRSVSMAVMLFVVSNVLGIKTSFSETEKKVLKDGSIYSKPITEYMRKNPDDQMPILLEMLNDYHIKILSIFTDMNKKIEAIDILRLISPEALKDKQSIKRAMIDLRKIKATLNSAERKIKFEHENIATVIENSTLNKEIRKEFIKHYGYSKSGQQESLSQLFKSEMAVVNSIENLYEFLLSSEYFYQTDIDKFIFSDDDDVNKYDHYVNEVIISIQRGADFWNEAQKRAHKRKKDFEMEIMRIRSK